MNKVSALILPWFKSYGRLFPWRENITPYRILISEWMLQRTRADLVPEIYNRFIERFPSLDCLLVQDKKMQQNLIDIVRPLGRTQRWKTLLKTAVELCNNYQGIPADPQVLEGVYGIGRYISRAVCIFGYGLDYGLVDPGIIRIFERCWSLFSQKKRPRDDLELWRFADSLIDPGMASEINWGLIDIGAVLCKKKNPLCESCPLNIICVFYQECMP